MGADAHVNILALLIEADGGVLGQIADVLHLELLLAVLHQLDGLGTGQGESLDGQVLLGDLVHLFFDGSQILVGQLDIAQIHIIVETILGGRAVAKVGVGVQTFDGLGHDMGGGVTQNVQFLVLGALSDGAVIVDDLHRSNSFLPNRIGNKNKRRFIPQNVHTG